MITIVMKNFKDKKIHFRILNAFLELILERKI